MITFYVLNCQNMVSNVIASMAFKWTQFGPELTTTEIRHTMAPYFRNLV